MRTAARIERLERWRADRRDGVRYVLSATIEGDDDSNDDKTPFMSEAEWVARYCTAD